MTDSRDPWRARYLAANPHYAHPPATDVARPWLQDGTLVVLHDPWTELDDLDARFLWRGEHTAAVRDAHLYTLTTDVTGAVELGIDMGCVPAGSPYRVTLVSTSPLR